MCYQITCQVCGKPTWAGCGEHIEQALADVPVGDRCPGHSEAEIAQHRSQGGFFQRLFARG